RLKHLHKLHLLPERKYSYHWVLQDIAQNCPKLRELKIIYDGDCLMEENGISILQNCKYLQAIWFFNYGRRSETGSVCQLLKMLPTLKILFHKELPNAILELTQGEERTWNYYVADASRTTDMCCLDSLDYTRTYELQSEALSSLSLERVDLCWYQAGIGYQSIYIPSSYLLRVAQTCPNISILNLIGSTCLRQIISRLPKLQVIILQQTSFATSLRCALKGNSLDKLTVLRLSDVWDITYDMMSYLAQSCSSLQVLSISCSSLQARGRLVYPSRRAPYPSLRHLILTPSTLECRPALTAPSAWHLGKNLLKYILKDAFSIKTVHVQLKDDELPVEDIPTSSDLEEVFASKKESMTEILLEWPPHISPDFVANIVEGCPKLSKLGEVTTWPLTHEQCANIITGFHHVIDIS
ncbi:hypothetical protein SK128_001558, partial [Halocaridina rubra]